MSKVFLFVMIALVAMTSCQQTTPGARSPIEGVWEIVELKTVGPEGETTNLAPQPNLYFFSRQHYSMVWAPGSEPRKESAKTWFPTDEEKIGDFDTIIVNSGTYELTDTTLVTHPTVAKTPEYVGGRGVYTYRVEADTLWMTMVDLYSSDGVQDPYIVYYKNPLKLVRVE
jgi:hypothetical protein